MENFFEYTNGELFCESVSVSSIKDFLQKQSFKTVSPVFVYSKNQIVSNVNAYKLAMKKLEINAVLNYAMKANMNPTVLKIMKDLGCSVTLVSGNELALALKVGFDLRTMILNGNGKQKWEIELAVKHGCLLNIDGMFNLEQTIEVCRRLGTKARVLLRVNPNIPLDDGVHQYNRTGVHGSKFGIERRELAAMAEVVCREPLLELQGLHCHLGSTITDIRVFRCAAEAMLADIRELRKHDFPNIRVINLGGGLGIDYTKRSSSTQNPCANEKSAIDNAKRGIPTPSEVISVIDSVFKDDDVSLILEPGRSLIGNAVILLTEVIGVKHGHHMNYIVVDGSMTEVVRPALYGAYHHIDLAQPSHVTNADTHTNDRSHVTTSDTQYITAQHRQMTKTDGQTENPFSFTSGKENPAELGKRTPTDGRSDEVNEGWGSGRQTYEVVGPVCESGDFLGHARSLRTPHTGCLMAVFDVGAYCGSMASNYNMRPRPAEVMVDGKEVKVIRRPDTFDDILRPYTWD
ncbi:uncharacterized protein LOC128208963 isoform X2 [Mya arenaria]|uniref:uncharacterized protein LOC128208963 isoform X2 n=1 Tax=Mya arenaria TaxID=6604 RepID=UPI0022E2EDAA|nr:uncharacterized protein LOC128208963 isoform X2 [Mya arenaria]